MNKNYVHDQSEYQYPDGNRYQQLLASVERLTGTGVWSYDGITEEFWWSDQAKRLLQIDSDSQPEFQDVIRSFPEDDRSTAVGAFTDALAEPEPFEVHGWITTEGRNERYLRIRAEPQQLAETAVKLFGTVENVTDVKRQEQRIEVLRRTSQQLREANSCQAVAEIMAETSKNILGYVNTTVRLVDSSEEVLRTIVTTEECVERAGERPDYSIYEATPAARTYRTGEPELHTDHRTTEDERDRGELMSGLYVPIGDHGVLSAGDVMIDAFDNRDIEAASLLGQLGAKAITRIDWTKRSRAI
ncbi:GAF domain-containing protein [Natrarchaeobius sp. A-rgal3]|uniref:GAF domain-containing protein n=1 Tax=Natrarchaeobius versutus TaxID=1679078 RepID=UPI00350F3F51